MKTTNKTKPPTKAKAVPKAKATAAKASTVRGWSRGKIAELKAIIEAHGGDSDGFWQQRSDCYEHMVARRSLSELDRFYSLLFQPGKCFADIREHCPAWPKSSKHKGGRPSDTVLSKIRSRFAQEKTINDVGFVRTFLTRFKDRTESTDLTELLDSVCRMLGHEVVSSKMGGMPISEQLRAVDRLLKRETQRISWTKVKAWLDDETTKAIQSLVEESKGDAKAVELLKKVEARMRELHSTAESRVATAA